MHARVRAVSRGLVVAGAVLMLLLSTAASASAADWATEDAMVASTYPPARATFVADPGQGRWARGDLIASYAAYYRARQFGNILLWAPFRPVYDPGPVATWAGCGISHFGPCPVEAIHFGAVASDLADPRLQALEWDGAFIALSCGNFSGRRVSGPVPSITGAKYEDIDGDGQRDAGEPGLAGWTIQLLQHGKVLATTQTDGSGNYSFDLDANALAIDAEDFEVREVQQDGWVASAAPGPIHVPFGSATATFGGNDFGNYRPARIDGLKYEDMEADGDRDASDPGLAGWTIELSGGPSAAQSQQTGPDGAYAFTGLRPGTYAVSEVLQSGWRFSAPADGQRTITVHSGETRTAEFGNYRPATIQGVKFDDHDVDRERDGTDEGLQGWTISLSGGRSADASTATGADGAYRFDGLIPGTYRVEETQRAHWRQSAPASGTHTLTVRSGDVAGGDFGNVCLGTASVILTDEATGAPVTGVEVRIDEVAVPGVLANDPALPRTTTGAPTFADLLPGIYRIVVFLPEGTYTTDPALTIVDGRLAVVKKVVVPECGSMAAGVKLIRSSSGKVTGGMKMDVPGGYATAGFVFMTKLGVPSGTLEYVDHATGLNLHADMIEQIWVTKTDAWIGGKVDVGGTMRRFQLHLVDAGEPGTEDRFELLIDNGYKRGYGETIEGGNDQIHPPERT